MGKRTVKNYPSPRLMQTIGATNQSAAEAIGELVANCFDARVGEDKLNIIVDLRNGQIAVIDDGKGMTEDILERAVCIAEDMSQYLERGESAKGHFGMGFKTSCATLGKYYEIYTRPIEESAEYHVAFDITEYSKRPSGADAWDVVIEDGPERPTSPLGKSSHGSAFVIKRLNDKDVRASAVITYLGSAFKGHIDTGDRITVVTADGTYPAIPEKRKFVEGTMVPIDMLCGPDDSLHITGWVALDQQTHNDGLYGFNIYRNGQLVDSWNKDWFKPHLMTSRIFGEVEMDFLDATFYKQGLQQTENWKIASTRMAEFLKAVVKASRALSRKGNINNQTEKKKIIAEMQESYGLDSSSVPIPEGVEESKPEEKPFKRTISTKVKTLIKEDELELENGIVIPITLLEWTLSEGITTPFDYIYEDDIEDEPELQVIVYTDHPLFAEKENQSTIRILATADAIFRVLVERHSFDSGKAFNIKNKWIMKKLETKEGK